MKTQLTVFFTTVLSIFCYGQTFYDNAPCMTISPGSGNSFDWTAINYQIHTISLGTTTIQSPFHLTSLNNPNVNTFSKYQLKDNEPNKGWSLVTHDFGTTINRKDVIYFILYNKHTGLLRVFLAFAYLLEQNNGITISLDYKRDDLRSAIFENYNEKNYRNATKSFENEVTKIQNSNFYINQRLTWYSTDFYLHYDPCVCNYSSSFILTASLIKSSDLTIKFDGKLLQDISGITPPDSKGRLGENGIFSWFDKDAYKSQPVFRDLYTGSQFGKKLVESKWLNLSSSTKSSWLGLFNGFIENIPILGAAANFLTSIFEKNSPQQSVKPLSFDISLIGNGSLKLETISDIREIPIPGSSQTLFSTEIKPFYNAVPGIFTLLEIPEMDYWEHKSYADEWYPYEFHETYTTVEYKLRSNKILYTINPHANFDIQNSIIKGQLIFLGTKEGEVFETPLSELGCLSYYLKYFWSIRREEYNPDYATIEEGWVPNQVLLKIAANFKVLGSNLEIPYVGTYNIKLIDNWPTNPTGIDQNPDLTCNTKFPEATANEVKSICNSTEYKNLVMEYYSEEVNKEVKDTTKIEYSSFIAFPNPASGTTILLRNKYLKETIDLDVKIISLNGQILMDKKIEKFNQQSTIDISTMPNGSHFLIITTLKGTQSLKILISK